MRGWFRRLAVLCAALTLATPALTQTTAFNWPADYVAADTDRPGADFLGFDLPRNEPNGANLCATACAQNGQCRAYTYVKPGVQGPEARCYLKQSAPPAQSNACCVSGARSGNQLVVQAAAPNPFVTEATRRRVGYASIPASGVVPVAIVIFDFGGGFPADDGGLPYDADYFEALSFAPAVGNPDEFAATWSVRLPSGRMYQRRGTTSQHSLSSFYWEASNHKLLLAPAGPVIGPVMLQRGPEKDETYTPRKAAEAVARTYGERLRLFDKNGDGRLTPTEFAIMVYDNGSESGAATRWTGQQCYRPEGSPVDLCLRVGLHGFRSTSQIGRAHV